MEFFITFHARNNFKLNMFQGNRYFCVFFVDMFWGKSDSSFFSPTATNVDS